MALTSIETFLEPDFFSIGTNDLTHELYNISREDETNEIFNHINDLIESLKRVVKFCNEKNISLSICGELASIKEVAIRFYEIGIKNLSVSPASMAMLNMAYDEFINKN
jgi:phosphoenolpyruvate-protein kinase (PTS system EI component)